VLPACKQHIGRRDAALRDDQAGSISLCGAIRALRPPLVETASRTGLPLVSADLPSRKVSRFAAEVMYRHITAHNDSLSDAES